MSLNISPISIDKFKLLLKLYNFSKEEFITFAYNFYDAIAFNEYLWENEYYLKTDFNSPELYKKLEDFFDKKNIEINSRKKMIISTPMIFSCKDFNSQIDIIYKDSELEGIIIIDENNIKHPYRISNNYRSGIVENKSLLNDLVHTNDNNFKKVYYTKVK